MNEYRGKKLQAIGKKIMQLIEESEILMDAETRHVNEYDSAEEVCKGINESIQFLRKAAYANMQAVAASELEDIQDDMQEKMNQFKVL